MAGTWSHPDAFVTWSSRSIVVGQVLAYVRAPEVVPYRLSPAITVSGFQPSKAILCCPPPSNIPGTFSWTHPLRSQSSGLQHTLEARSQCTGSVSHCWPPWPSVQQLHDLGRLWSGMLFRTEMIARQSLQRAAGRVVYTSLLTTTRRNGQSPCGNQTLQP